MRGVISHVTQQSCPRLMSPKSRDISRRCSGNSTHPLVSRLSKAETANDWASTLEVMTEVKIMKIDLPSEALECAVRTYCVSGQQWERATVLFEGLLARGVKPADLTVSALFDALATGRQGTKAHALLKGIEASGCDGPVRSPLHNLVVRALVREGEMDAAFALLEEIMRSDGSIVVQESTFSAVAHELLKAGRHAQAEEVLEMRDYL